MKQFIIIALLPLCIAACTTTETSTSAAKAQRAEYRVAENGRDLVVPAPLSDYLISHEFDIKENRGAVGIELTPPRGVDVAAKENGERRGQDA